MMLHDNPLLRWIVIVLLALPGSLESHSFVEQDSSEIRFANLKKPLRFLSRQLGLQQAAGHSTAARGGVYCKIQDLVLVGRSWARNQEPQNISILFRHRAAVVQIACGVPLGRLRRRFLDARDGGDVGDSGRPHRHGVSSRGVDIRKTATPASGSAAMVTHTGANPKWSTMEPINGERMVCIKP